MIWSNLKSVEVSCLFWLLALMKNFSEKWPRTSEGIIFQIFEGRQLNDGKSDQVEFLTQIKKICL